MKVAQELYSIVVLGEMNPAIHNPGWYRLMNLIDDDEMNQACESNNSFHMPPISQLETNSFKIICQQGRYEIQTPSLGSTVKIRKIVASVFDDLLKHTPVRAYGFNFIFRRKTQLSNVAAALAKRLASLDVGLSSENVASGEFTLRYNLETKTIAVTVGPVQDELIASMASNYHYPITVEGFDHFKIGPMIEETYEKDLQEATQRVDELVKSLDKVK